MTLNRIFICSFLLLGLCNPALAKVPSFSSVVVFGDSLSDTGNFYHYKKGKMLTPPYYQGRASNGPLWVEYLTADLGLSAQQLIDQAYAGAETNSDSPPGVLTQINTYLSHHPQLDSHALYIVWIGANNYLRHPFRRSSQVKSTLADIQNGLILLINHGAKVILVPNLPDLGSTPLAINLQQRYPHLKLKKHLSQNTQAHNQGLVELLKNLNQQFNRQGIILVSMDVYTLMLVAEHQPQNLGLINITVPCYLSHPIFKGGGQPCQDPEKYLFWDQVHPTTQGHEMIADLALDELKAIP